MVSKALLERSWHPADKEFWSHILGFRRLPTHLAKTFPAVWCAIVKAELILQFQFFLPERIVCTLGRWSRKFVVLAFRAYFPHMSHRVV